MKNEQTRTSELHKLRTLHLFAGAGGGILADILLGHHPVCAVEIEPYCQQVLSARQKDGHLPWFPIFDDVQTFDGKPWRGLVDVVAGGFPCQDISSAGKGAGIEGSRSSMWKHMARIIGEVRPRYAFVENSPMLVGRGLSVVLADLAEMGYDAKWGIVGAHHVSAPHRRDRIWILANSKGAGTWKNIRGIWERSCGADRRQESSPEEMANSNLSQRKGMRCTSRSNQEYSDIVPRCSWWRQDPAEALESPVGRMAHGVANRVDRLKAIGNGQVPGVAATAWQVLTNQLHKKPLVYKG